MARDTLMENVQNNKRMHSPEELLGILQHAYSNHSFLYDMIDYTLNGQIHDLYHIRQVALLLRTPSDFIDEIELIISKFEKERKMYRSMKKKLPENYNEWLETN